jgi:hypothetical protein
MDKEVFVETASAHALHCYGALGIDPSPDSSEIAQESCDHGICGYASERKAIAGLRGRLGIVHVATWIWYLRMYLISYSKNVEGKV